MESQIQNLVYTAAKIIKDAYRVDFLPERSVVNSPDGYNLGEE